MAYKSTRRRKPISEINVVPYIDVMLVLLIIFMVTAPLLQQGVDVKLPSAPSRPLRTDIELPEPLYVTVQRQGRIILSIGGKQNQSIAPEALAGSVRAILTTEPRRPVYVKGDAQASYQYVITAMVALKNAGVEGVGLITEPPIISPEDE